MIRHWIIGIGIAWVAALGGCVSVRVPDVDVDAPGVRVRTDRDRAHRDDEEIALPRNDDEPGRKKVSKDEAYAIAKTVSRREGVRPEQYEIHDKKIEDVFWVIFEQKNPRGDDWRDHFTIRVAPDGAVEFYRTGLISKDHPYRRGEINGDAAKEIAKAVADREGVQPWKYDIHDKGVRDNVWVFFERKGAGGEGWKEHFAVRVGKDARATLYAGD
jgi:hypothetical protein